MSTESKKGSDGARIAPPSQRGFTLMEVLVAFMIIAVTLGGAYGALGSAARGADRADAALQALGKAEGVLDRLGADLPLAPGRRTLEEDGWSVVIAIEEWRPEGGAVWTAVGAEPFLVEVEAIAEDGGSARLRALRLGDAP